MFAFKLMDLELDARVSIHERFQCACSVTNDLEKFFFDKTRNRAFGLARIPVIKHTHFERVINIGLNEKWFGHSSLVLPELIEVIDLPEHKSHKARIGFRDEWKGDACIFDSADHIIPAYLG